MIKKWIFALKLPSWPKILVPFVLGHALGFHQTGSFDALSFALSSIFAICGVAFIVLVNDIRDIAVDTIKRTLFVDGCSPKTIPDGYLTKGQLQIAAAIFFAVGMAVIGWWGWHLNLQALLPFALICCGVFIVYSLPPIQLNYRGGGEILEMIGVGILMPLFSFFIQSKGWELSPYIGCLLLTSLWALSSALASGLSDEVSDQLGKKNTFTTLFGNSKVRFSINTLMIIGIAVYIGLMVDPFHLWSMILAIIVGVWIVFKTTLLYKCSSKATTSQFFEINVYKNHLHQIIWWGQLGVGLWYIMLRFVF